MVQLKKKVTLKTKTPNQDSIIPSETKSAEYEKKVEDVSSTTTSKQTNVNGGKGKLWAGLLVVCALLIGGYFVLGDDNHSQNSVVGNEGKLVVENSETQGTPKEKDHLSQGEPSEVETQNPTAQPESSDVNQSKSTNDLETSAKPKKKLDSAKKTTNIAVATSKSNHINGTLVQKANAVIRGDYGNGHERKQKLGSEYTEIQNKVNEMYKNGLVD